MKTLVKRKKPPIYISKALLKKIIKHVIKKIVYKYFSSYDEIVWLIGSGRSGTTWVSSLINHDKRYREVFEPFHPEIKSKIRFLKPHQYIRPTSIDSDFSRIASSVFSGKFTNRRTESGNERICYKHLLIKDIFANLFAYHISNHFNKIKIIFLIRNPFAVAYSKYENKSWFWMTDPIDFLDQPDLLEDYLQPFENLIREISKNGDFIEKQIIIWSIINYIPLLQFKSNQLCVVFYEDIITNPNSELSKINKFLNPEHPNSNINIREEVFSTPSIVSSKKNAFHISSWQKELTTKQIDSGLRILDHFGLRNLYNYDSTPNRSVIKELKFI